MLYSPQRLRMFWPNTCCKSDDFYDGLFWFPQSHASRLHHPWTLSWPGVPALLQHGSSSWSHVCVFIIKQLKQMKKREKGEKNRRRKLSYPWRSSGNDLCSLRIKGKWFCRLILQCWGMVASGVEASINSGISVFHSWTLQSGPGGGFGVYTTINNLCMVLTANKDFKTPPDKSFPQITVTCSDIKEAGKAARTIQSLHLSLNWNTTTLLCINLSCVFERRFANLSFKHWEQ